MGGARCGEQTRRMTFPTVIEITPQLEAVTPDTFITTMAPPRGDVDRAGDRTAAADRERGASYR